MTICAPNPFGCCGGSSLLKGGYSYWPLWWYGQRDELPDMSGHGVTLYPSGAYYDGQGYYFDGSDDYLVDAGGRRVLDRYTKGSWHSVYLTEGVVPVKGSIWGTGTELWMNVSGTAPKITGKIVFRAKYCPNLEWFSCHYNNISVLDVSALTQLYKLYCYNNNISVLDVSRLTQLYKLYCNYNNISVLDVSGALSLKHFHCYNNSMNQDMVDTVLCDIDSHGLSGGYLRIQGNTAPSATGEICRDNLVSRGWGVTTD